MTDALTSRFFATCFTGEVEVGFDTDGNIEFTKGPNQKYTLRSNAGLRKRVQATSGPSQIHETTATSGAMSSLSVQSRGRRTSTGGASPPARCSS
jgi:hypothetical protein